MHRAIVLLVISGCGAGDGPQIRSIEPEGGIVGDHVEINGFRFCGDEAEVATDGSCDPPPSGYVSFGIDPQIDAQVEIWKDEHIAAIVPDGVSGSVQVVLTVDGRSSNGVWFEVR